MQILVQGQNTHVVDVSATSTVDDVMAFIQTAEGQAAATFNDTVNLNLL